MPRSLWKSLLAAMACAVLLSPVAWADHHEQPAEMPCETVCDADLGRCSTQCANEVDNNLCSKECLDRKDDCVDACREDER